MIGGQSEYRDGAEQGGNVAAARKVKTGSPRISLPRRAKKRPDGLKRVMPQSSWLRHFDDVEALAGMGSWRLDLASATMEWTRQACRLFGLDPDMHSPAWDRFLMFYPFNDRMVLMQAIDRAIDTGKSFEVETDILTEDGQRRRIRNVGKVDIREGEAGCLIGVCQDVTAQREIERALERSALVDELTGIANRAALNQYLNDRVDKRQASDGLAVVLLDLDNFKSVNDTYGHHTGDDVLQRTAQTLATHAEAIGFAARLGGDEFVLAITARDTIERLRLFLATLLSDLSVSVNGDAGTIVVRATMGACLLDDGITTRSDILRRADLSLYNAKALGKGRAMVAGDLRPIMPVDSGTC